MIFLMPPEVRIYHFIVLDGFTRQVAGTAKKIGTERVINTQAILHGIERGNMREYNVYPTLLSFQSAGV